MSGLAIASSLLTAFLLAALALRVLMMRPPPHRSNGVWRIDLSLGGEHAGLYLKAFTAWHSLFALAAALGLAQSQRPKIGPPPHSGVAADVQLPDGKSQRDEILKAEHEQNLKDVARLSELAGELKEAMEKEDRFVTFPMCRSCGSAPGRMTKRWRAN